MKKRSRDGELQIGFTINVGELIRRLVWKAVWRKIRGRPR